MTPPARTLPTGERVHIWMPDGDPRAVVVLQHGLAEHATRFVTDHGGIIPALRQSGIAVYAMDLRGHGASPGPRRVVDVRAAVRAHLWLRDRAAELRVPVVALGHSLGGLVTAGSVARRPEGLAAAVLLSRALLETPPAPVVRAGLLLGKVLPRMPVRRISGSDEELTRDPTARSHMRADPLMSSGPVPARTGATILAVSRDVWRGASAWTVPTLIVHGTDDNVTEPANSRRLADLIGPRATYVAVTDGRHELLHDADGPRTLHLVLGWIDEHLAGVRPTG